MLNIFVKLKFTNIFKKKGFKLKIGLIFFVKCSFKYFHSLIIILLMLIFQKII